MRRQNHHQRNEEAHALPIEELHRANDVDSIDVIGAGVGEDRDQNMLFHVERSWIQRKFRPSSPQKLPIGDRRRHEVAERNHGNLSGDRGQGERFFTVPEELLEERQNDASEDSEEPRSKRDGRQRRIVCDRNREGDLLNRRVFLRRNIPID